MRKALPRLGAEAAVQFIQEQTAQGRDVNRRYNKPYTSDYKKAKTQKYGSASPVNLRAEGRLMASLGDFTEQGLVAPTSEQAKKAAGNQKHRDFLTPSMGMRNYVGDKLRTRILQFLA